jgi:hypothetical protein
MLYLTYQGPKRPPWNKGQANRPEAAAQIERSLDDSD